MARLIGRVPQESEPLKALWKFVMEELPDWIYAVFEPEFVLESGKSLECDAVLFVPHMGVFVLDVNHAMGIRREDGIWKYTYRNGMTREVALERRMMDQRFVVRQYLKEHFFVTPLVYELQCYPYFQVDEETLRQTMTFDPDHMIFGEDFRSDLDFLKKLYRGKTAEEMRHATRGMYDDLSDKTALWIFRNWFGRVEEPKRPENPPMIFLSYNQKNQMRAEEIKAEFEKRGIFTWRAPEDVSIGGDYFPEEMEAIRTCTAFVILISPSSQISPEVRKEFDAARKMGKYIIMVLVDACDLVEPYASYVSHSQYRIMTEANDPAILDEIAEKIRELNG